MKTYRTILAIPDMHCPYHHRDAFNFLKAVRDFYKPDKVVCLGDEVDLHAVSMHDHDPDMPSPGKELEMVLRAMKQLYEIFPVVDLVESNHGSLYYRRAKKFGLPKKVMKSYNQILEAPETWRWHDDLVVYCSNGKPIYFCHNQTQDVLKNSMNRAMSYIQGHFHGKFEIRYWANSLDLYFGVTSGCLIDNKSLAFAYGRAALNKPILGCTVIKDGIPILIPMVLNKKGRWIGAIK